MQTLFGASPTRRERIDRHDPDPMLWLLAPPLGLTAPRAHAAAAAQVPPRAPAVAALAAGSSSALSFEEWCAAGPASPSSDPNQRCLTCSSPTRSPQSPSGEPYP